jgi:tetratricopeptide (TPR) repeat protein
MTFMPSRPLSIQIAALLAVLFFASVCSAQNDEFQEAQKLFRGGQHAQALERVDVLLKSSPKDARSRFLKGLILTEQNKTAEAVRIFSALTEDYPELPEPYNNLAVLYAQQGQYDKARSALELSIRTHPSYATAHENLGDIYAKMASQAYGKALQLDKGNAGAQTKLGLIKELFSSSGKGVKPSATKADPVAKVATASPVPVIKPAPPAAVTPQPAPSAPVAAAATPPAPTKAAKPLTDQTSAEALKAVNGWAQAWSNNDVNAYLGYYAKDFRTPQGEQRSDWEASRKARIAKPKKIEVGIEQPKVSVTDAKRVSVTFRQNYNSPNLKVSGMKTLVMVKNGDRWQIQQELVGS